jgi:hypothetical protein
MIISTKILTRELTQRGRVQRTLSLPSLSLGVAVAEVADLILPFSPVAEAEEGHGRGQYGRLWPARHIVIRMGPVGTPEILPGLMDPRVANLTGTMETPEHRSNTQREGLAVEEALLV